MRISEDILEAAGVTEQECLIELAVHLYAERRLAFAHALRLAGLRRGTRSQRGDRRANPRAHVAVCHVGLYFLRLADRHTLIHWHLFAHKTPRLDEAFIYERSIDKPTPYGAKKRPRVANRRGMLACGPHK